VLLLRFQELKFNQGACTMKFKAIYQLLLLLFIAFSVSAQTSNQLVLGNPSKAGTDLEEANNYLVAHSSFVLSYNNERGAANWVFWHLENSDIGKVERTNAFAPDTTLPKDWWILPTAYSGSGYDRGHMCPSKDRSDTEERNKETFLMSNMQPQTPKLNQKTWKYLEDYTREIVGRDNEAYIYAGCYGDKGKIKEKVTIPTNCFKIIVLLPTGDDDLKRINQETRVIAVNMPNDETVSERWRTYLTTVDDIEAKTGYDFLSTVSKKNQKAIEAKIDNQNAETKTADTKTTKTEKTDTKSTDKSDRTYILGSRGGCYYLNSSGKKTYVDKKYCANLPAASTDSKEDSTTDKKDEKSEEKTDEEKEDNNSDSKKSETPKTDDKPADTPAKKKDGRTYIKGSRGGCYYLNDSGKKVYVKDKSLCEQN
jgi:endonuclease G, mitochondrial